MRNHSNSGAMLKRGKIESVRPYQSEKLATKDTKNTTATSYESDSSGVGDSRQTKKSSTSYDDKCPSPSAWIRELSQDAFPCFKETQSSSSQTTNSSHYDKNDLDQYRIAKKKDSDSHGSKRNMAYDRADYSQRLSDHLDGSNDRKNLEHRLGSGHVDGRNDVNSSSDESEEILSRISQRKLNALDKRLKRDYSKNDSHINSPTSTISTSQSSKTTKSNESGNKKHPKTVEITGEPRIVAPNVGRLSPQSVVEVKLQSAKECVSVQCSVDVLKMRSIYFHDLLAEQEGDRSKQATTALLANPSIPSWNRPLILIDEVSPFEAAAFLESLHEGRVLFKGEWNICWARLSVSWGIEDLIVEYAQQIELHTNTLLTKIQDNHWRTSPSILSGMKVAILRKGPTPLPTIVMGLCVEAAPTTGYSKIRVAFDVEKSASVSSAITLPNVCSNRPYCQPQMIAPSTKPTAQRATDSCVSYVVPILSPSKPDYPQSPSFTNQTKNKPKISDTMKLDILDTSDLNNTMEENDLETTERFSPNRHNFQEYSSMHQPTRQLPQTQQGVFIGDIGEPFWVQANKDGASWCDPDDIFLIEAKKWISITDKRIFWEMLQILIELPQISTKCRGKIQSARDISHILRKVENRILWTTDGPACLPKETALELLTSVYVIHNGSLSQLDK